MKQSSKPARRASIVSIAALESRVLFNTVINVNTFNDQVDAPGSATVSLRDALETAQTTGNTTINVPAGAYTLTMGQLELDSSTGLVKVSSVSGSATINAQSQSRVFYNVDGAALELDGITLFGGYGNDGDGAGILNAGNLTLTNSAVQLNKLIGDSEGAGIYNTGTLNISNSSIVNNSLAELNGKTLGGGIYNRGHLLLNESTVSGNTADHGAGIDNNGSSFTSNNSTISGNTSFYEGGGLVNIQTATLTNTTIANNHAEYHGGGILTASLLTLTNCTITGNSAESGDDVTDAYGGGITGASDLVTIGNSIVADNTVTAFGAAGTFAPDVYGDITSQGNNLIGQIDQFSTGWVASDLTGTAASPIDPMLQPLDYYGATVQNELPALDSPVINAGSNLLAQGITHDERGFARVVNGFVDIGADEVQLAIQPASPQNVFVKTATSISLGSFSDPGAKGPYMIDVRWGDGGADTQFSVNNSGSLGSVTHTYQGVSHYFGDVTVVDGYGNSLDAVEPDVMVSNAGSLLSGKVVGTSGSYHNLGNTVNKAFDGNISTFFDGPNANGNVAGLDLGSAHVITSIAYVSRLNFASRMNGGIFQGSNSPTFTSATTLYTIPGNANPSSSNFTTQSVNVPGSFRYVRYVSPAGSFGNVAEIEFFGVVPTKLTGTVIGTAGSYQNMGNTISKAFDGNLSTFFDGPNNNGDTVGLDLGSSKTITQISFAPRTNFATRMVGGFFQASNSANFSGPVTLFTISSAPTVGVLTTVSINQPTAFRYVRYVAPNGAYGDVAEIEFFS